MNLDLVLPDKASLDQEVRDVLALVTLELNYLAKLLVLHHIPVAAELFLEVLEDLLVAELLLQALHCGQTLLPIPLLDPNVHILLRSGGIRFSSLSKRVKWGGDLDFQLNHVLCLILTLQHPTQIASEKKKKPKRLSPCQFHNTTILSVRDHEISYQNMLIFSIKRLYPNFLIETILLGW